MKRQMILVLLFACFCSSISIKAQDKVPTYFAPRGDAGHAQIPSGSSRHVE